MEIISKRFEELTVNELYMILQARSEVFVNEQEIIYQDMDGIDLCSTHLFITEKGKLCSYLRIIDEGVKYPEISIGRVLTLKPYRRRGLSRKLMEAAIEEVKERGLPIKIEAQAYLKEFYENLGFEAVSDEFILEGIPHVEMIYSRDVKQ